MPLTSACISKKLKVGNSTATTLKRRLQLFLSDMIPSIKLLMAQDVRKDFPEGFSLPEKSEDITGLVEGKNVVFSDTLALFSASSRANGFRARHKHRGQTSSIFLSDEVALEKGKYQIGTLCHTLAIKGGAVLFTSVPDQTQKTIEPLLDFLPENHVHFSDEGFPWLARLNDNFRCVNHSARAKNLKRNVWARNRWSKNGTHNQVAEGNQRALKTCFRNYSYVSPEYSQMYLDEFSALKAIKVYGLVKLAEVKKFGESSAEILLSQTKKVRSDRFLKNKISTLKYTPPTPETRTHLNFSKSRKEIPKALKDILKFNDYFDLNQAVWDYLYYYDEPNKKRKQLETEINAQAMRIFRMISDNKSLSLKSISNASTVPYRRAIRIARIWAKLKIAEVTQIKSKGHKDEVVYYVRKLIPTLPGLLYSYDRDFFENQPVDWNGVEIFDDTSEPTKKGKYGLTKIQRINKLKEAGIEI